MKRGAPLKRRTRLRPRRSARRRSGRVRSATYLWWVKTALPCSLAGEGCFGVVEADHVGRRPLGRKCSDLEAVPLCTAHHRMRHERSGPFRRMTREEMRRWCDAAIAATQEKARRAGLLEPRQGAKGR